MARRDAFAPVDALLAAFAGQTRFRPSQLDLRATLPAHDGGPRVALGVACMERNVRAFLSLPRVTNARQRRRYGTAWERVGYASEPNSVGAVHLRWFGAERELRDDLVVLAHAHDLEVLRAMPARRPIERQQLARRCDFRRAIESARASVIPWNAAHLRYAKRIRLPHGLEVDVEVLAMQWPHERIKFHVYLVARSDGSVERELDGRSPLAKKMRGHGYDVSEHDSKLFSSRVMPSVEAAVAEGTRMLTALR